MNSVHVFAKRDSDLSDQLDINHHNKLTNTKARRCNMKKRGLKRFWSDSETIIDYKNAPLVNETGDRICYLQLFNQILISF